MPGQYGQVGDAGDIQQISPYADEVYNMITQMLGGNVGGDLVSQWLGSMPEIQGMAAGVSSPYGAARMQQAETMADQLRMDIAGKYAQSGNLRSSGFGRAVGQGMAGIMGGALADIVGKEQQLAGQFGMGAMNLLSQGAATKGSLMGSLAQAYGPTYYEPTYQYQPGFIDYLIAGAGAAGQAAGGFAAIGA